MRKILSKIMTSVLITAAVTASMAEAADKQQWDLGKNPIISSRYNAVWSIYMAGNMSDSQDSSDTWSQFNSWQQYRPDENINAETNGIRVVRGKSELDIYASKAAGMFSWKPASSAQSNGKGTAVIGWTASEKGNYVIEVGGRNKGTENAKSTEPTVHKIVSRKNGETTLNVLDEFTIYSATDGREFSMKKKYVLDAGETVYLLNDAGTDGFGDNLDIKFNITNSNLKTWQASDMYRQKIKDSPFRMWFLKHDNVNLSDFYAADLHAEKNEFSACKGDYVGSSYITINGDGYFYAAPDEDDDLGGNLGITFDVPEDGFYRVDFDVENIIGEGDDYAENSQAKLYFVTEYDETIGTPIEHIEEIVDELTGFSKVLHADKGDKILLTIEADYDCYGINLRGRYKVTELKELNCEYTLNGNKINSVRDLSNGGTLSVAADYLSNESRNVIMISAAYDSSGKMIAVGMSDSTAAETGKTCRLNTSVNLSNESNCTMIKSFVFANAELMIPLTKTEKLQ